MPDLLQGIGHFAHAPVSPAEYKRMQKYISETALIDVLLTALAGYYPDLVRFQKALEGI